MEDKTIKELFKCDVPDISFDAKKILHICEVRAKYNRKIKIVSYCIVAIFICLIVSLVVVITNKPAVLQPKEKTDEVLIPRDCDPFKVADSLVSVGYIDYCVAYGNDDLANKYKSSILYDKEIISEADLEILKANDLKNGDRLINLYFARKDGKDIIVVSYLQKPFGDEGTLVFDSNLSFKFDDLISEFEDIIDEEITIDFLNQRYQDNQEQVLPSGIYLELLDKNEMYSIKFTLYYKNQVHIIYK